MPRSERRRLAYPVLAACLVAFWLGANPAGASDLIGDAERGQKQFSQCKGCHQVGTGAENKIGPHLNGLFGRPAAGLDDYQYSKGMKRAGADGVVWTIENVDVFLEQPKAIVTSTRMNFRGLRDAEKRANLIAYLRTFSDNPSDIPEAEPTASGTNHDLDPAILAIKGDPDYGEYLSSECQTCHRADGGNDGIPSITNWPINDFVIAMHAYKTKKRPHPVMQMMAGRLNNDEIAALAAYFEGL